MFTNLPVLAIAASLAALGTMAGTTLVSKAGSQPLQCAIAVSQRGGTVTLEGSVFANSAIAGSYTLLASKSGGSGSADITQSGSFTAQPGATTTLGMVTLGGGGSYLARLKVTARGETYECTKRVGGGAT